jgi:hypothetical protein
MIFISKCNFMPKKVKITKDQLNVLIEHIHNNDMSKPIGFINESYFEKEILEEGWKQTLLIAAAALGVALTGVNKVQAQKAMNDPQALSQAIEQVSTEEGLDAVADSLEAAGLKNAKEKILNNAERVQDKLNAKAFQVTGVKGGLKIKHGKKTKEAHVSNYQDLAKKLKAGYAISGIYQDTVKKVVKEKFPTDPVMDTLQVKMNAGDLFTTGAYQLSDDAGTAIQDFFSQLESQGFIVTGVKVISSTDWERIDMGNEKLAQLRADAITNVIPSKYDSVMAKPDLRPNSGPDVYTQLYKDYEDGKMSASEFKEKRDDARAKPDVAINRSVDIIVDGFKVPDNPPEDIEIETEKDVIVYSFDVAKVFSDQSLIKWKFNWDGKHTTKTEKCNTDCPAWNKSTPKVGGQKVKNF